MSLASIFASRRRKWSSRLTVFGDTCVEHTARPRVAHLLGTDCVNVDIPSWTVNGDRLRPLLEALLERFFGLTFTASLTRYWLRVAAALTHAEVLPRLNSTFLDRFVTSGVTQTVLEGLVDSVFATLQTRPRTNIFTSFHTLLLKSPRTRATLLRVIARFDTPFRLASCRL